MYISYYIVLFAIAPALKANVISFEKNLCWKCYHFIFHFHISILTVIVVFKITLITYSNNIIMHNRYGNSRSINTYYKYYEVNFPISKFNFIIVHLHKVLFSTINGLYKFKYFMFWYQLTDVILLYHIFLIREYFICSKYRYSRH